MRTESAPATRPWQSGALARIVDAVPPASGASVMGTAIISIGLSIDGREIFSRVLLALASALWVGCAAVAVDRFVRARERFLAEAGSPAALTVVAGTAVLGSRLLLLGWEALAEATLALAFCLWAGLVPRVLRAWTLPTVGGSFVLAVSTESLAALAALVAIAQHETWLGVAALVFLVLGVVAYAFVLVRFDLRQLLVGLGDHWVAGGALAIATLACGRTAEAADLFQPLRGIHELLVLGTLAVWSAAALWLPALLVGELWSRRTRYDVRRWSTVFPFGMYAVCSFVAGKVAAVGGLKSFAQIWIWVAVAVWAAVTLGMLRRALALIGQPEPPLLGSTQLIGIDQHPQGVRH